MASLIGWVHIQNDPCIVIIIPRVTTKLCGGGYIGFTPSVRPSVHLSVRLQEDDNISMSEQHAVHLASPDTCIKYAIQMSIRPSLIPCPLCSAYSSGWILFPFIHSYQATSGGAPCLAKLQTLNFREFFKICNFVLFWLRIWCESLVWVIMGLRGYLRTQVF